MEDYYLTEKITIEKYKTVMYLTLKCKMEGEE